ncbi:MAG: recombinase family protein [Oscillospiraceae bacterium]
MKKNIGLGKVTAWEKPSQSEKQKRGADDRIRAAFQGDNAVVVIPAQIAAEPGPGKKLRVAAYCRVSTDEENQISSYELQINYYREHIERNKDWVLAGIYADRGLSGTAMRNRAGLLRMLEDCRAGKIDHIITKSVARFSRNVRDCLATIDELLALKPPVDVDFEVDGINSARDRFETELFFSSFIAQNESIKKSRVIRWALQIRFSKGLALVPTHNILGYDKDRDGNIVIVPKEAKVVRYIYARYLDGMCTAEIAAALTQAQIPTVRGFPTWRTGAVRSILCSEKYVGDALMQKTYTPDCLSHKSVINKGVLPQYYKKSHHSAIISRVDWDEVQRQLVLRRYERICKKKPEVSYRARRIKSGYFQGFLVIPTRLGVAKAQLFLQQIEETQSETIERGIDYDTIKS